MDINVESYMSPQCAFFRKLVRSMDMDDAISICGSELITRREIEQQVREWKKNKKKPRSAATPKGKNR